MTVSLVRGRSVESGFCLQPFTRKCSATNKKPPTASNIFEIFFQVFEEVEVIVIRHFGPGKIQILRALGSHSALIRDSETQKTSPAVTADRSTNEQAVFNPDIARIWC